MSVRSVDISAQLFYIVAKFSVFTM